MRNRFILFSQEAAYVYIQSYGQWLSGRLLFECLGFVYFCPEKPHAVMDTLWILWIIPAAFAVEGKTVSSPPLCLGSVSQNVRMYLIAKSYSVGCGERNQCYLQAGENVSIRGWCVAILMCVIKKTCISF